MKCTNTINILIVSIILVIFAATKLNAQDASPCPRIFVYESKTKEHDRWYGILTLLRDTDLKGVWLRIVFDRPIKRLGNWFGEVVSRSKNHTDYLIRSPNYRLKAFTPKLVRIFVEYDVNQPPPRLIEFRINAEVVCPEDLVTTTPSTTTEQLFTSSLEETTSLNLDSNDIRQATSQFTHVETTTSAPPSPPVAVHDISTSGTSTNLSEICGTVAAPSSRFRRHVGQVAHKGEYPWHGMIFLTKGITVNYLCGATLISEYYLITVAHCVIKMGTVTPIDPDYLVIYLGRYYAQQLDTTGSQLNYVQRITSHSEYNPETYDNDIALLKLFSEVHFTNSVRPICLWKESDSLVSVANKAGTVIGWGFDKKGKIEPKLMFVNMFVQSNEKCSNALSYYWNRFTTNKTFCANFVDESIECVGDSGGAIVFPSVNPITGRSVWHLRGLLTISVVLQNQLVCGRDRYVIFTDIAKYRQWIEQNTAS